MKWSSLELRMSVNEGRDREIEIDLQLSVENSQFKNIVGCTHF